MPFKSCTQNLLIMDYWLSRWTQELLTLLVLYLIPPTLMTAEHTLSYHLPLVLQGEVEGCALSPCFPLGRPPPGTSLWDAPLGDPRGRGGFHWPTGLAGTSPIQEHGWSLWKQSRGKKVLFFFSRWTPQVYWDKFGQNLKVKQFLNHSSGSLSLSFLSHPNSRNPDAERAIG